ncbi:hypothetical protein L5515_015431 [Caenorhabditis briggsae]|uniref:Uncharacterized protein n=1 Tax=Caenorhabditis briggsae TaxID=6238 RepID=A0AAE9J8S9_CAEBR|nr:hypothetical protein L5515_015431 [Caenorhabditis briggsae]
MSYSPNKTAQSEMKPFSSFSPIPDYSMENGFQGFEFPNPEGFQNPEVHSIPEYTVPVEAEVTLPFMAPGMESSCAQCEDLKFKIRQFEDIVHSCTQNLNDSRIAYSEELRTSNEKDLEIKKLMDHLDESRMIVDSHQRKILEVRSIGNEKNQFLQSQNFKLRGELRKKEAMLSQADGYKMTLKQKIEEKDSRILSLEQKVHSLQEHLNEQLRKNKCLENYMKEQGYYVMEYDQDSEKLKRIQENKKIRDQMRAQNERTPMKRRMSDEPEMETPTKIAKE